MPQLAADLSGNVQQYEVFMEALRRASPVPREIKPVARDTDCLLYTSNPNGLILGTPGSGKSFSAKREITNAFLILYLIHI